MEIKKFSKYSKYSALLGKNIFYSHLKLCYSPSIKDDNLTIKINFREYSPFCHCFISLKKIVNCRELIILQVTHKIRNHSPWNRFEYNKVSMEFMFRIITHIFKQCDETPRRIFT